MLFSEIIAVYFENHVIHINRFGGKMPNFDVFKLVFLIVNSMCKVKRLLNIYQLFTYAL